VKGDLVVDEGSADNHLNPEEENIPQCIEEDEYNIQFGPKTMQALTYAVDTSYKLFWDGEISAYVDTDRSSDNNKQFVNCILEMRARTEQEMQPPVVCIHGHATEKCLRQTLTHIKQDQLREQEEAKARAANRQRGSDDEDEEEEPVDLEETDDKHSTFEEDINNVADFIVAKSTPFSTKLL